MQKKRLTGFLVLGLLLVVGLALAACQPAAPTAVATEPPVTEQPVCPTAVPCPETAPSEAGVAVPFVELWQASAHADAEAEAFVHWNEEDPAEVPPSCAKCHAAGGFQDFVGADGSAMFAVDAPAAIGTVIDCTTCHNAATMDLGTVQFPSGVELTGLGNEAVCLTCHQGTASEVQVNASIEAAGLTDEDAVSADLGFTNIHYFAAAVSRFGTIVNGGYQYDGMAYDALFEHAGGIDECQDCHNPHSLEIEVELCAECHTGVATIEDVRAIRFMSSLVDYDGDGDVSEGIPGEIEGLQAALYTAMQAYSVNVSEAPLIYTTEAYPYFFNDTNADGEVAEDEAVFPNSYKSWTPRLAKAAFNYQTSIKDPGAFAHGGKYIIELLYDSIVNLNEGLGDNAVDVTAFVRTDPGHFDGSSEAFRHWDEDGEVAVGCVKCHSAEGLPMFLENGAVVGVEPSNGLLCESCHASLTDFSLYTVEAVKFPSGATLTFGEEDLASNLCLNCHQGRESTTSVNARTRDAEDDAVVEGLSFVNVHYFAAGATLFGTEAKGVYEYEGKEYVGQFMHVDDLNSCAECHDAHALEAEVQVCSGCHQVEDPRDIRMSLTADYDGDGDVEEGVAGEIETMTEQLLVALQAYATETVGTSIAYNSHAHPYWFIDADANGTIEEGEADRYATWTPRLLRAAYNYQYAQKDPGAFVHNGAYVLQVLYDSIEDVGGDVTGMTRP